MHRSIGKATMKKLVEVWPEATSLNHAFELIGISTNNQRNLHRYRRQAEAELGVSLLAHQPQHSTEHEIECPSTLDIKQARRHKDFIVTSSTNNAPLVENFLTALERFTTEKSGQLLVVPVRYKNPNTITRTEDYEWPERIIPYVLKDDLHIGKNLLISATRIQATAVNPLAGKAPVSGPKSAVYGHPQLAMEVVPSHPKDLPKIMHTTGSISRPRYSSTDAGSKAKFHHNLSAIYIQVSGTKFYPIQLMWDGEGFYYFDEYWTDNGKEVAERAAGMVFGDDHVYHERPDVTKAREQIRKIVNPIYQVRHDILDFHSQSHHNTTLEKIAIAKGGDWLIEKELQGVVRYLNKNSAGSATWIIESNHDNALEKWMNRFNPKDDPHNAPLYFKLMGLKTDNPKKSALELAIADQLKHTTRFVGRNERARIEGIDVSQHGDVGSNGARGGLKSFAKTTNKMITGHNHVPGIEKGAWSVGCGTDKMAYRQGLSSWMLSDCIIYANGKRALTFYVNGNFRR